MKCERYKRDFLEKDIQESHDVPCYLFLGSRRLQKQQTDKYRRRWLCKECHAKYEKMLRENLFKHAQRVGYVFFKNKEDEDDTNTQDTTTGRN
jgi:hypothetical protein